MSLALGGDCLADVAVLCAQPELAGPVAFDPVISRLVSALAAGRAAGDPHSPGCLWVPKNPVTACGVPECGHRLLTRASAQPARIR